jgi:oxygen-independent coproporphyrinogen-3 oxidase
MPPAANGGGNGCGCPAERMCPFVNTTAKTTAAEAVREAEDAFAAKSEAQAADDIPLHRWPPRALYIHIPFCASKCPYCDFNSYVAEGQPVDRYLEALEREMELTARQFPPAPLMSMFVGGGTPTVLSPKQLRRLMEAVRRHFPLERDAEITMEANPGSTDPAKLEALREGGVNRISFGAQSFDDGLLAAIGRDHTARDVAISVREARRAGFGNISIDLMFGLPGQTPQHFADSVEQALDLDLPHYSMYSLKIEENTPFHQLYRRGELRLPDEDAEADMYEHLRRRLAEAGYGQYEISNFARPGFESRHNLTYWRNEPYYGIGAGAHGYVKGRRHVNVKGVEAYIEAASRGLPRLSESRVSAREAMEDFMMVGLRMLTGVRSSDFAAQFGGLRPEDVFGDTLADLAARGLLEPVGPGEGYRLSERGLMLGNVVFGAFVS